MAKLFGIEEKEVLLSLIESKCDEVLANLKEKIKNTSNPYDERQYGLTYNFVKASYLTLKEKIKENSDA